MVVVFLLALQAFIILETKRLVSPERVTQIREVYSKYERVMYTDGVGVVHTESYSYGARGIPGFFNESNFHRLSRRDKNDICQVPLSQPLFLRAILFIWTMTC